MNIILFFQSQRVFGLSELSELDEFSLVYKNYFLVELTNCLRKTEESNVILGNVLRCNKFVWPQDIYHSRMQELTIKVFEVN